MISFKVRPRDFREKTRRKSRKTCHGAQYISENKCTVQYDNSVKFNCKFLMGEVNIHIVSIFEYLSNLDLCCSKYSRCRRVLTMVFSSSYGLASLHNYTFNSALIKQVSLR